MKTSQTINNNKKIIEIIWNLLILTLLGINASFIVAILTNLLLNTPNTFWHTFVTFLLTVPAILLLTSKIHEYGHTIAIHYFRPDLETTIKLTHTDCDWKQLSDEAIPIVAVAGIFTVLAITTIASAISYFLGFKLLHFAFLTAGNIQLLGNMLSRKTSDEYALLHPHEFKLRTK